MNHTAPVARGAAELDRILPGWEQKIDVGALDLASECRCPLGQLAVDFLAPVTSGITPYDRALNAIQPALDDEDLMAWSEDHGFDLPIEASYGGPADFVDLTQAWKDLITKRLEAE